MFSNWLKRRIPSGKEDRTVDRPHQREGMRQGGGAPRSGPGLWWALMISFLIWDVIAIFWPRTQTPVAIIPYSTFLSQVRADNVSSVHIVNAAITGTFTKPFLWPEPSPLKEPEPKSPQKSPAVNPQPTTKTSNHFTAFQTTFPAAVGDAGLINLLESHQVVINVSSPPTPWLFDALVEWGPMLLLIGFFWWMATRTSRSQSGLFGIGRVKARRYSSERPAITFKDVAGAGEAKAELQEEVDFLKHPKKYHDLGAHIPKGVLLVGPPGTGKTLLARAVAGEAGVPFFSLNASEFVEMFVGVGASRVRDLFRQAKEAAPGIVFIDELDAVGRRRGAGVGTVNDEREQTLNQLLGELDGFDERFEVIVLAATNRPDVLDPALLRPGRFDRRVVVGLPDREGREGILRIHTRKVRLSPDVDLSILSRATMGMSGADLANLCNEAALTAARYNREAVTTADFEEAIDKVRLGAALPPLTNPGERRIVAYHECGHATVAWLTPNADPVRKVTIIPHGHALGLTEQLPGEDRQNYSQSYLMARLAVMLGGRTSEEIVFGDVTTGAENDLVEATRLARRMVTRWGMSNLGLAAFKVDEQQPFLGYEISQARDYSEATAARIDHAVQTLLDETHQGVKRLLSEARDRLDQLVETLLSKETLAAEELTRVLGPRPQPQDGQYESQTAKSVRRA
jgi:cell division protease FtsH